MQDRIRCTRLVSPMRCRRTRGCQGGADCHRSGCDHCVGCVVGAVSKLAMRFGQAICRFSGWLYEVGAGIQQLIINRCEHDISDAHRIIDTKDRESRLNNCFVAECRKCGVGVIQEFGIKGAVKESTKCPS